MDHVVLRELMDRVNVSAMPGERITREEDDVASAHLATSLRHAVVHWFRARNVTCTREPVSWRNGVPDGTFLIKSANSNWIARPVGGLSFAAYELTELPEAYSLLRSRSLLALDPDAGGWLLNHKRGFADFVAARADRIPIPVLARLVTHLFGRGMERLLLPEDLRPAGVAALRTAHATAYAPRREVHAGGKWELRFLSATAAESTVRDKLALALREWTVHGRPHRDVAWEIRELVGSVTGAVYWHQD